MYAAYKVGNIQQRYLKFNLHKLHFLYTFSWQEKTEASDMLSYYYYLTLFKLAGHKPNLFFNRVLFHLCRNARSDGRSNEMCQQRNKQKKTNKQRNKQSLTIETSSSPSSDPVFCLSFINLALSVSSAALFLFCLFGSLALVILIAPPASSDGTCE